ncbi:MAG: hypothetical protein AABW79_01690 [Nanoarchaeota archaeon]
MVFGISRGDFDSRMNAKSLAKSAFDNYMIENPKWTIENRGKFVGVVFDNEGKLMSPATWAEHIYPTRESAFVDRVRAQLSSGERGNTYFDRIGFFAGGEDITEKFLSDLVLPRVIEGIV